MNEKRLTLSDHRLLGGVCGGFAEFIGIDPTIVRVIYAVLTLFTCFCGIILYPILYWIIPSKYKVQ
ncbi:MAG: PspC domain-containing protein [Prevotella sp.]|nr:PspC domain-containing protein [Prevotella sp.]